MEKVAMPDWLRNTLSVFGRIAGRVLRKIAIGVAIAVLLGKDHHHTRIGLPSVNKLPSTSRLFRTKTIRLPK